MSDLYKYREIKVDLVQAFDIMRIFLQTYWEIGDRKSNDIAMLLSSLNRESASNALPLDQALWNDWIAAFKSR